jgi:hypothetical protein
LRGDGTKGSSAMALKLGRRGPPSRPAGPVRPSEMGRRRSAFGPEAMGRMGFK